MPTQFEFHLKGAPSPEGQLDADRLIAIVQSLKDVALSIGRTETKAERVGRAPARVHRVATLVIGMIPGSTTILARRAGAGEGALDFDLADELAFDSKFVDLVRSIAVDQRPSWVDDSLSVAAGALTSALQQAAPEVQFVADGRTRTSFQTANLHSATWQVTAADSSEPISYIGRLYAVNLNTHRLSVQDDVGHQVALPNVTDNNEFGRLLDHQVEIIGLPTFDSQGTLTQIRDATIVPAPDTTRGSGLPGNLLLPEILESAPGPDPDGGIDLTDDEFESFLKTVRG